MSVQVVYKNSKKIANFKIQAIFTSENFKLSEINSLSKVEISKLKKLINLKNDNSNIVRKRLPEINENFSEVSCFK